MKLRDARKRLKRKEAEAAAAQNRLRFGQTKAERSRIETEERLAKGRMDGARLQLDDEQE